MPYDGLKARQARERLAKAMIAAQGQEFTTGAPVQGNRVSSGFGERVHPVTGQRKLHTGVDYRAGEGEPIYATADGLISQNQSARSGSVRGNNVSIKHPGGQETRYEHMQRFSPQALKGGAVQKGDLLGYVGSTGRSTGPHLHYGLFEGDRPVNPLKRMRET